MTPTTDRRHQMWQATAAPRRARIKGDAGLPESLDGTGANGRAGERPTLFATLKRTVREFQDDGLTDWAAALTYYGLLSLFPALIALVGIIGLFADPREATQTITEVVTDLGPATATDTFAGPIQSITENSTTSGLMAIVGLFLAVWAASGYVGAFIRASNVIYETDEGRPFWHLRPLQLAICVICLLVAALVLVALVATGPLAEAIGRAVGLSDEAVAVYGIAKWPILIGLVITIIAFLYYVSPNAKLRGFRWVTPGSIVAVVLWVVASAAFALYVANFGSYDKTYGTLGGVVALLVWLWITNLAILFGHQLNAERERRQELEDGVPGAATEIKLEPRVAPEGNGSA